MNSQPAKSLSLQPTKQLRITIFGAESTGKTTFTRQLAAELDATWLYEFARPYLEITKRVVTVDSMTAIWRGQTVLQTMAEGSCIIQDTDLFSTVGYWQFPHWCSVLGACPQPLIEDAAQLRSNLYIITPSNIPFEPDTLRTGGGAREGSDNYWINICKQYQLPYVVLQSSNQQQRLREALDHIKKVRLSPCVD
ncbi:ATP-binding protein [Patescibacteria group bacterium]|nr:ATP-binding protein [Patescibacteria group bacterium]